MSSFDNQTNLGRVRKMGEILDHIETSARSNRALWARQVEDRAQKTLPGPARERTMHGARQARAMALALERQVTP